MSGQEHPNVGMSSGIASVDVRRIGAGDVLAVRAFFDSVPEGDRTFFREDVSAPGVIESWTTDVDAHRFVALVDGSIAGYLAVLPGVAWSRHVAELRLVVGPDHRRMGVGRSLARHAVVESAGIGVTKLVVEVVAQQEPTVAMFSALGFEAEGLLKDHVRSLDGEVHDLLVLSHFVDDLWSAMTTMGIDDAVGQ